MILKVDIRSFSALQNSSVSFVENCVRTHQTSTSIWNSMRKTVSTPAYIAIECSATNVCLISTSDQSMVQVEDKSLTAAFVITACLQSFRAHPKICKAKSFCNKLGHQLMKTFPFFECIVWLSMGSAFYGFFIQAFVSDLWPIQVWPIFWVRYLWQSCNIFSFD